MIPRASQAHTSAQLKIYMTPTQLGLLEPKAVWKSRGQCTACDGRFRLCMVLRAELKGPDRQKKPSTEEKLAINIEMVLNTTRLFRKLTWIPFYVNFWS